MKKSLFLIATAALVLASCNNDVKIAENRTLGNEPQEIGFFPLTHNVKRAAADTKQYAIDGAVFPTDLNMYVAAYQVEPTEANYFAGTQFIYGYSAGSSASGNKWGGVTAKYWPLSPCFINFLAYTNVTGTAVFNATKYASAATITQSDNSSTQTDLMYAIGHGQVNQSGNNLDFPTKVDMAFKHAQAWMDFYVKANSTVETAITINSITLKEAKYSGKYIITHTNYNATSGQSVAGAWSNTSTQKDVVVPGWAAATLTTSLVHVGNGLMIVPDDDAATNDWTGFVINYTYDGKTYDYVYTAPSAPAANVDQAKHYVFNITFKLHEIFVAATVTDWTDVAATNITVKE